MDAAARQLLIRLLALWHDWPERRAWYLSHHVPTIISIGPSAGRSAEERATLRSFRRHVGTEEWEALGLLLVQVEKRDRGPVAQFRANAYRAQRRGEAYRAQRAANSRRSDGTEANSLGDREVGDEGHGAGGRDTEVSASAPVLDQQQTQDSRQTNRNDLAREHEADRLRLLIRLKEELEQHFLTVDDWLRSNDPRRLISDEEFRSLKIDFVRAWCEANLTNPDGMPFEPDHQQALAIATSSQHALLSARAGSGKTATMVARAAFLVRACGVEPGKILMLAFNGAAADEMYDRLEKLMPPGGVPHVMTFHALAHRIVHPSENLLFDKSDSMRALSRRVQDTCDEFMRAPGKHDLVRDVMLAHFKRDWKRIVERGDHLSPADQIAYRLRLQSESIKGDFVKSYGEKLIADILFTNGISGDGRGGESYYGYEHDVRWNGQNYKPDFSIYDQTKKRRIVIEYFGRKGTPDYDDQSQRKRDFWAGRDEVFLEYFAADVAKPGFEDRLLGDLDRYGAPLRRLSDEELWHRVKKRALDRFTDTTTTIINRARQRRWTGQDLHQAWADLGANDPDLDRFLTISAEILDSYSADLAANAEEDFSGLIWRAVDEIRSGTSSFGHGGEVDGDLRNLEHIVVDEFQDFSFMFSELLQSIVQIAPGSRIMAVGDDWQAINEFAGSTTAYFGSFEADFSPAVRLSLQQSRRSASDIVALGNNVMKGRGVPARASREERGQVRQFVAETFEPSPLESSIFGEYDCTTPALLRLIQDHRSRRHTVAVLSRKRRGGWSMRLNGETRSFSEFVAYGDHLREILGADDPREIQFSSTHGFKGQEADAVILLDVTQRNYPLIHPTWMLFQVFGDTVESLTEAERRLFYVGITRPRVHLDVVTTARDPSEFWTAARKTNRFVSGTWDALPQVHLPGMDANVEIRVDNSSAVDFKRSTTLLKSNGFHFRRTAVSYWWRILPADEWDSAALHQEQWA